MSTRKDFQVMIYYKSYRANVRAKVNSLRACSDGSETAKNVCLSEVDKFLQLMDQYINLLVDE